MNASDDYCELCDLPKSQCIHGRPPAPPAPTVRAVSSQPRVKAPAVRKSSASAPPRRTVPRRFTPPEVFRPLIVSVLQQAGGELPNDALFDEVELLADEHLLPGDRETTPEGELRWRYAVRRARVTLIADGLMVKGRPGVWQLA